MFVMMTRKVKAAAWKSIMWLFESPLKNPSDNEQRQLNQLRDLLSALPDADENVSSEAGRAWNKNLNRLKNKINKRDPREFLRWDVIRETMFVGNAEYISVELSYLKAHKEWATRWQHSIRESTQGRPTLYYRYMKSSGNLIHHAYHLARFEDATGQRIDQLSSIFEFGGGYGSMCRLVHQLGFKGKYVILDLPHFTHLQRYYLNSLGLDVKATEQFDDEHGIFCVNELKDLARVKIGGQGSLFIATWSFSETPIYVREPLLPLIDLCQSLLIAYQDEFGEVDNGSYFSGRPEFKTYRNFINQKITHLQGMGSHYFFSWGKCI